MAPQDKTTRRRTRPVIRRAHSAVSRGKRGQKKGSREHRALAQLIVSLLLFAVVFFGRGLPLSRTLGVGQAIGQAVRWNTDLRAAFEEVGLSVSNGESVRETFGLLLSEVFGSRTESEAEQTDQNPEDTGQPEESQETTDTAQDSAPDSSEQQNTESETSEDSADATAESSNALGLSETITPVMGVLTSGYGDRINPLDGQEEFHYGIDLMADEGTDILAFADGTVDYIGESDAYGLYLQLRHDNGITSFYAHCSKLCVKKGQQVKAGEKIAEVGQTGNATGPHLHFELKKDGEHIDPLAYVETLGK